MHVDLKKAITSYMLDNVKDFQLTNNTTEKFRQYIYTSEGEYCFGGKEVSEFITSFAKLIKK